MIFHKGARTTLNCAGHHLFLLFQNMSAQLDLKQMTTLFGQAVSGGDIVLESYCAGYRELSK